jgi:hypothetical protein
MKKPKWKKKPFNGSVQYLIEYSTRETHNASKPSDFESSTGLAQESSIIYFRKAGGSEAGFAPYLTLLFSIISH